MEEKLGNLAEVLMGLSYRRYKDETGKIYKILTLRSIKNIEIDTKELDEFTSQEEIDSKYLTKKDDIILGLFSPYSATIIRENTENIIVPLSFAIIRAKKINPEYLVYYLNSNEAQKELEKNSFGTTVSKISMKYLKDLPVKKLDSEKEEEYLKLMNILNERIYLKNKELSLLKDIQKYYLNRLGE